MLQDQATGLKSDETVLQDRVERLRRDVESLAVARFATSGSKGIPLLTGLQAPKDQVQADVLVDVVTDAGSSSLDEFELAQKQLAVKQREQSGPAHGGLPRRLSTAGSKRIPPEERLQGSRAPLRRWRK